MDDKTRKEDLNLSPKPTTEAKEGKKKWLKPPQDEDPNDPATKLMAYCPHCLLYFNFHDTSALWAP